MSNERTGIDYPHIPFLEFLGVRFLKVADGIGELELPLGPQHLNSFEMAHGGVTMTLLDVSMAMAARSLEPAARGAVTIEMKTSFLQPGRGVLRGLGRCVHRTSSLLFCEAEITDAHGAIVARASGTFKLLPAAERPAS